MKKAAVIFAITVILFAMIGRSAMRAVSPELKEALTEVESELTSQLIKMHDAEFWNSALQATNLVVSSIREDKEYRIDFTLETSEGEEILVEQIRSFPNLAMRWRDLYKKQLLVALASDEKVAVAHAEGQKVRVAGVVLTYFEKLPSGNIGSVEARDLDMDGKWDLMDRR